SAGAGAPVAAAAAGSAGGIGIGALALGAAAIGVAAAAAGGRGGGSAAAAPTPAPTPAPVIIHGFSDYMAAVNQAGATAATNATIAAGPAAHVDVSGGFSRSALPHTLTDLRPSTTYNVTGASAATINESGIAVDLQGNPTADSRVSAHSDAG